MRDLTEKEFLAEFRERLKRARVSRGLTQAEVAQFLGIESEDTYGSYERRSTLPLFYLPRTAKLLDVSLEWLITGEGPTKRGLAVVSGAGGG